MTLPDLDSNVPSPDAPSDARSNRRVIWVVLAVVLGVTVINSWRRGESAPAPAERMALERDELDATIWADEVTAQAYEQRFVALWDSLRNSSDAFAVLEKFQFESLGVGEPQASESLDLGIQRTRYSNVERRIGHEEFATLLQTFKSSGYKLVESEWHHSNFEPDVDGAPRSTVSFVLHITRNAPTSISQPAPTEQRMIVRGDLLVSWAVDQNERGLPVAKTLEAVNVRVLRRDGGSVYRKILTANYEANYGSEQPPRFLPLLVYDLDGDGLSEILLPRWNRLYRNLGGGQFQQVPLFTKYHRFSEAGSLGDFNGDGHTDLIMVGHDGQLKRFDGNRAGTFPDDPHDCAQVDFEFPTGMTSGDIDADGDLDLFVPQYVLPYRDGQMPRPIFDANDGRPSYLLLNDGQGNFTDATESAGLAPKRHRRTFASSLVDLDDDGDLDLMVTSDFSGVDLYRNRGDGTFEDVTDRMLENRSLFGMGHTLADFNLDGRLDAYVTGMSSTTARRLDLMKLNRDDRPEIDAMRGVMGYGNRMYLAVENRFEEPPFAASVARTGWSWGTTAMDFDNDADADIYVANGQRSGKSAQDYCTRFWCHDIYTGDSKPDLATSILFGNSLAPLHRLEMSWNGFEHNVLLMNQQGQDFASIGFLMGVAFEYDARSVVSDDLDGDGRLDLLVVQATTKRQFSQTTLHVYQNRLETDNHWIGFQLRESTPGFSPIGAKITLKHAGRVQVQQIVTGDSYLAQHANTVHFGLGDAEQVDEVEVRWPNGKVTLIKNPEVDRYHHIRPAIATP